MLFTLVLGSNQCSSSFSMGSSLNNANPDWLTSRHPISWLSVTKNSSTVVEPSKPTTWFENKKKEFEYFQPIDSSKRVDALPDRFHWENGQGWRAVESDGKDFWAGWRALPSETAWLRAHPSEGSARELVGNRKRICPSPSWCRHCVADAIEDTTTACYSEERKGRRSRPAVAIPAQRWRVHCQICCLLTKNRSKWNQNDGDGANRSPKKGATMK